jgi:predicted dinucleotide-binding enzyme
MNKNNLAIVIGGTGAIGNAIASEIENLGFQDVIKIGTKTITFN